MVLDHVLKKRTEQRDRHMEKFHKASMTNEKESQATATVPVPSEIVSRHGTLSLQLSSANIPSLPEAMLQAIVRKSEELLNREGAITPAPGNNNAYMVASQTTTKPHFVQLKENGKVICDGCPSFTSAKLCAHVVAASKKAGVLEKYIKWLSKNGPKTMNLTSYITYDSNKDTGKKKCQASTVRRKGNRSSRVPPVTNVMDRPFNVTSSTSPSNEPRQQQNLLQPSAVPVLPHQMVETLYSVATLPQQAAQAQHSTPRSTQPAWQAQYSPSSVQQQAVQANYPAPTLPQQAVQAHYPAPTLPQISLPTSTTTNFNQATRPTFVHPTAIERSI